MTRRILWKLLGCGALLAASVGCRATAQDRPVDQRRLAHFLANGSVEERSDALEVVKSIKASSVSSEVRSALISTLRTEGLLHADRRRGINRAISDPEYIGRLAFVVANLRDPRAIPALAGALGTSPRAATALGEFGNDGAVAVLEAMRGTEDPAVVMDALLALRFAAERHQTQPLAVDTRQEMVAIARVSLTAQRSVTTLWGAIDLAIALGDVGLRQQVQRIASDAEHVRSLGVFEPDLIQRTQARAADRLARIRK